MQPILMYKMLSCFEIDLCINKYEKHSHALYLSHIFFALFIYEQNTQQKMAYAAQTCFVAKL